ncbi:hypothetical protein [Sorangium sp. So ce117]|uniref:hypothetical protein n=1 Tax=Sorangium sp. So ce117 TaxID=3133277 RepID=UPI003F63BCDA
MSEAWILPRGEQSILFRRTAAPSYREGAAALVEVGPVPMPVRAVHRLDIEADRLVIARHGALTVIRGLSGERAASVVDIQGNPDIHAIFVIDDVAFTGGDAGEGMLGWVDLRAPQKWRPIGVPREARAAGKGIDGFAMRGSRLVAIDDRVLPRFMLLVDVTSPREPRLVESLTLVDHGSFERVVSVASTSDTVALLSHSPSRVGPWTHVAFIDLRTLQQWAVLHVRRLEGSRRSAERSYGFHAIALHGDLLFVAAGEDGIGVLRVPPRPRDLAPRNPTEPPHRIPWDASIPIEGMRFLPVPRGPVIDVVPVDEARAFAVVEVRAGGIFGRTRLDSVLVSTGGGVEAPPQTRG